MDAICGLYDPDQSTLRADDLQPMLQVMAMRPHAGLDTFTSDADRAPGRVVFGLRRGPGPDAARRRSAIRLPRQDGLAAVCDVRLDNRDELLEALGGVAGPASESTDAEIVVRAFEHWRTDSVSRLLGDFAFALWDGRTRRLFCGRDFIGVRPFYYGQIGRRVAFATEIEALLALPGSERRLDLRKLRTELSAPLWWDHLERTPYAWVRKLPAGHVLQAGPDGVRTHRWWNPEAVPGMPGLNDAAYAEGLRAVLDQAVRCRMPSAAHTGVHCSGGLDSSAIAAIAGRISQRSGQAVTAISWSPPPGDPNTVAEQALVEIVRKASNLPVIYDGLGADDVAEAMTADVAVRPIDTLESEWATSRAAAGRGISVILSGWGGDELIGFNGAGAARSRGLATWRQLLVQTPRLLSTWLPSGAARRTLTGPLPDYLQSDFAHALAQTDPFALPELASHTGVRQAQLTSLGDGHLTRRLESWADHGSRRGLRYAFPLLDKRVVEYALGVPERLYFRDGWGRYVFRLALDGIVPDEVRWNSVKNDPALLRHVRQVRQLAMPAVRAALIERGNRRLVVPERQLPVLDWIAAPSGRPSRTLRAGLKGFWLAFVASATW